MTDDRIPGFETVARAWDLARGPDHVAFALARKGEDGAISYAPVDVQSLKIITTSPPCRPISSVTRGVRTVTGSITARLDVVPGDLERFFNCHRNRVLRVVRGHMPKRAFRRMRGRLKAERRAARAAAYRLMKAKARQLERAYENRFYETMFGTVPPRQEH